MPRLPNIFVALRFSSYSTISRQVCLFVGKKEIFSRVRCNSARKFHGLRQKIMELFTSGDISRERKKVRKEIAFPTVSKFENVTDKSITMRCRQVFCYARAQTLKQIAESISGIRKIKALIIHLGFPSAFTAAKVATRLRKEKLKRERERIVGIRVEQKNPFSLFAVGSRTGFRRAGPLLSAVRGAARSSRVGNK